MDWQVGDLAVCVDASARNGNAPTSHRFLTQDAIYTVVGIVRPQRWKGGNVAVGLVLAETRNPTAPSGEFIHERFRKIRPDEQQACEPEFITLLKRSKIPETASDWLIRVAVRVTEQVREWRKEDEDNGRPW